MIDIASISKEMFAESCFYDSHKQLRHVVHSRICSTEKRDELQQKAAEDIYRLFAQKRK